MFECETAASIPEAADFLAVIELFCLIYRFAGEVYTEFFEYIHINLRENYCGVRLASAQEIKAFNSRIGVRVAP